MNKSAAKKELLNAIVDILHKDDDMFPDHVQGDDGLGEKFPSGTRTNKGIGGRAIVLYRLALLERKWVNRYERVERANDALVAISRKRKTL